MSAANPRRRFYRRFSDERIWREFFCACLTAIGSMRAGDATTPLIEIQSDAAKMADHAYAEYRNRFPVRAPALDDDEPAALDSELAGQGSTGHTKGKPQ